MSLQKTAALLFVFAIISRIIFIFIFPPGGTDHEMLHIAVDNLSNGKGLTFPIATSQDLSTIVYEPMQEWPTLIAYILSLAKVITGSAKMADLLLMSTSMFLLLTVFRSIMQSINLSYNSQSLIWILIACNPDPFRKLGLTDIFSCLFYLWSVLFVIRFLHTDAIKKSQLFIASIIFFLPAAFRYQYYPLIFLFPFYLIFSGYIKKEKKLLTSGVFSLSIVFFLLAGQMALLVQTTGNSAYIPEDLKGFFPENLILTYPFILKSFFSLSYLENKLFSFASVTIIPYRVFILIITALSIAFLSRYFLKKLLPGKREVLFSIQPLLLSRLLLFVSGTLVFLFLAILSATYHAQENLSGGIGFTYVSEGRYFISSSLIYLLLISSFLQSTKHLSLKSTEINWKRLAIAGLTSFNLLLFGKFLLNTATNSLKKPDQEWLAEKTIIFSEIEEMKEKYHLPVLIASSNKYFSYQPISSEYGILKNFKKLMCEGINTSRPVQVVFVTSPNVSIQEKEFIRKTNAALLYSGNKCNLYHLIVAHNGSLAMLE